jgi:hypothetical protein
MKIPGPSVAADRIREATRGHMHIHTYIRTYIHTYIHHIHTIKIPGPSVAADRIREVTTGQKVCQPGCGCDDWTSSGYSRDEPDVSDICVAVYMGFVCVYTYILYTFIQQYTIFDEFGEKPRTGRGKAYEEAMAEAKKQEKIEKQEENEKSKKKTPRSKLVFEKVVDDDELPPQQQGQDSEMEMDSDKEMELDFEKKQRAEIHELVRIHTYKYNVACLTIDCFKYRILCGDKIHVLVCIHT